MGIYIMEKPVYQKMKKMKVKHIWILFSFFLLLFLIYARLRGYFNFLCMQTESFGLLGQFTQVFFGIGGIMVVALAYGVYVYNSIIHTKNTANEALSAIDTVLQNRYNLIPNLVELVKRYMSHEAGLIAQVSEMRTRLVSSGEPGSIDRFQNENALQAGMKSIFAIAESYPELKASNNFLELQTQWSELEDRLQ